MNNMKKKLVLFASVAIALASCQTTPKEDYNWIKKGLDVASAQLQLTAEEIDGTGKLPRSIRTGYDMDFLCRQLERDPSTFQDSLRPQPTAEQMGKRRLCVVYDWTSGFFPGSLWYAYELTGNDTLKADAIQYTNLLNPVRYYKGTHDLGFMINCSYGNAERLAPNDTIKAVMKETADNLSGRFNDSIGAIRSWDFGSWNFPVIIDNMMNLDLLFTVSKWTGDNKYKDVAIKHAITTMKNHFRPDYTCWHVVSYNNDGTVERKQTHQGKNDDSSWSRGQAWAVYGYTSCYRETNDTTFLNFAVNIADMIMERVSDVLSGVPFMVVTTLFQLHLANKVGVVPALLFAFVLTGWIGMASRVRMQFYRFKGQEYILAARTLGAGDMRLMFKHIFPNSLGTLITGSVLVIPGVIFSESSLTYLGIINLESSTMTSVGTMLANGKAYLSTDPYIIMFPALFISLLEISFNLFGNGLRDAFNPSLRGVE